MASRRAQAADALRAVLNGITLAGGYNTDLGNRGGAQKPQTTSNTALVKPFVIVSVPRERKDDSVVHNAIHNTLSFEISAAPDLVEDGYIEDDIELLVEDVERALLVAKAADPPLGLPGVINLRVLGHDKLPMNGDYVFPGAVLDVEVIYRHDVTDPATYGGVP